MTENYFKAIEIEEGIFHIYEPGGVYTTLIVGTKKALLIDTGYGFADLSAFVRTLTDKPIEVMVTHGHTDHCGGNYLFPNVYMNMEDIPTYLWYATVQRPMIVDKFERDRNAAGLAPVWPEGFDKEAYLETKNRHFSELKDGQIFDLGGRTETIIAFPGHTTGCVAVYDDKSGFLFAGDNIGPSIWIFFDTSAQLTKYALKLMDLEKFPYRGIVYSHSDKIYGREIISDILMAIGCIDPEKDKTFTHPRTGQKALLHKEACVYAKDVPYIYLVYEKNNL